MQRNTAGVESGGDSSGTLLMWPLLWQPCLPKIGRGKLRLHANMEDRSDQINIKKNRKFLKGCVLFTNSYVALAEKVSVICLVKFEAIFFKG